MTTQASPATVFNGLLDRALAAVRYRPNEFELKKLEREADSLTRIDPAGSFEIRAHIAAAQNNVDEMNSLYSRALSLSRDHISTVMRYLVVLGGLAESEKVRDVFRSNWQQIRTVPDALRLGRQILIGQGWYQTANQVNPELQKMGLPTDPVDDYCVVEDKVAEEEDVAAAVGFVRKYLRNMNARMSGVHTLAVPQEDGRSAILYQFILDQTPERATEIEWDLFAVLTEKAFVAEVSGAIVLAIGSGEPESDARH